MSAILVVEQDPGYANRVVAALEAAGHAVSHVATRDDAEAAVAAGSFDLVLANGMMPGASDLLGRFSKGRGGPGSVVLLPVTLASHTEAGSYSADDILSKPFSDEDLDRVVTGRLSAPPALASSGASQPSPETPQPAAPEAAPQPSQPAAPQPPQPPQPAAFQPPAPRPTSVKPAAVNSDIDDLLNKTLSGLDISSLTRKKRRPKAKAPSASAPPAAAPLPTAPSPEPTPATPQPAAPPPAAPQPAAPQPAAPQPAAPQPAAPQPAAPQPAAPQPAAPQPAPEPPPQPASKPLTSTDIFGDVLAEVEAESEKTRAGARAAAAMDSSVTEPTTPAPGTPGPPSAEAPRPAQPSPPAAPAPAPSTPAPAPAPRHQAYDDDLDRKLEETLSGVLPSRLRRKAEEKPPEAAAPPQNFGAPAADAATPEPALEPPEPDLPVDFSEDVTVSIVRPVTEPREPTSPAPEPPAESEESPTEHDFFATTLLPTQVEKPSTQVQPPADFVPPSESASLETPQPVAPQPAAPEPAAPQPAAPKSAAPPAEDSGDEFDISFGESEPAKPEEDANIWSAYGTDETAGWGTTSFEAQAPAAAQEPTPEAEAEASEPVQAEPVQAEPVQAEADLDASAWGADSGWSADTGWGTADSNAAAPSSEPIESDSAEPVPAESIQGEPVQAEPDFGSDSVWEVPSFEEESTAFEVTAPEPVAEAPSFDAAEVEKSFDDGADDGTPEDLAFQPPTFEEGPSLGEDPELDFASSDFAPEPDSAPAPPEPVADTSSPVPSPADATGSLGELSSELGADESGSFHTALQGVLQIRGDDGDSGSSDDQGVPFGDYRLLERVAVGGMAEVWRARRRGVEGFQKTVAIKRILSHLTGSADFINMFIDEAKLAAQLNHANIAQIYDLGKVDDDFFIAMEFVEGRDLRTLLREAKQKGRPLPVGQALLIVAAVARALDYAHRKRDFEDRDLGLVHRDVSPQNVLVSTEGEIKLCDFGIVKAVAKASTTQMGALKGKLQYMSPEQAWGKEVDGRSDIFSLGSVMFEALTGEKLFTGDSEIGVLDAVRDCRIKSARAIDPSIPESVEAVLSKTLTASPDDRYQTAGEMERDIQSVLETLKPSPGPSELARYMHGLLEAPEPGAEQATEESAAAPATTVGADEDGTAWTGTAWGTASFTQDEADPSEPVSAKIPVAASQPEPVSSKPPEPATSKPPAMSSSQVPIPAKEKKGGGKLIWILLLITMLAIVAVVAWTRLGSAGSESTDAPAAGSAPVAAPATESAAETAGELPADSEAATDAEATAGDAEAEDPEAIMQQMLQEEMERKKQEMEEKFEAQRREIERRLKEVEGEDG